MERGLSLHIYCFLMSKIGDENISESLKETEFLYVLQRNADKRGAKPSNKL